jgi:hypothetical protein
MHTEMDGSVQAMGVSLCLHYNKEILQTMAKLHDMFTQARRGQSGGGMGFLGKNRAETKPRAAAIVIEFPQVTAGSAEAALKAGADGLLFRWDGKDNALLDTIKQEVDSAKTSNENVVCGLHITGGWNKLDRESLLHIKEQGIHYIILPLDAPAHLLAIEGKEIEKVLAVPMQTGELYPIFIRNLTSFDALAGVLLDFNLGNDLGEMTVQDMLHYIAVREAVRVPALINVEADLNEADGYTLMALGVQALILTASREDETTKQRISAVRELLEKIHQEEKEIPSLRK